jgi:hypothetical protein
VCRADEFGQVSNAARCRVPAKTWPPTVGTRDDGAASTPPFAEPEHDGPTRLTTPKVEWLTSSLDDNAIKERAVINRWYAAWGDDPKLRGHLLSRDDGKFTGALYELYLRALFVAHGYDVEIPPKVTDEVRHPRLPVRDRGPRTHVVRQRRRASDRRSVRPASHQGQPRHSGHRGIPAR